MAFKGNTIKEGHLYPGTPTSERNPIGFIKTCQTGHFEFMYFKDYVIEEDGLIKFKTFEEEFRECGRNYDTKFRFYSAFLRIPEELVYMGINKKFSELVEPNNIEKINKYRGLFLFNINAKNVDNESTCAKTYFDFDMHYETGLEDAVSTFDPEDYYPSKGFAGNPRNGCQAFGYIGPNKPIFFRFEENALQKSYLILTLGTDYSVTFAEIKNEDKTRAKNKISDLLSDIKNSPVMKKTNGHSHQNLILGIKNLNPIIYNTNRFNKNYGLSILLDADNGWKKGYWELIPY